MKTELTDLIKEIVRQVMQLIGESLRNLADKFTWIKELLEPFLHGLIKST